MYHLPYTVRILRAEFTEPTSHRLNCEPEECAEFSNETRDRDLRAGFPSGVAIRGNPAALHAGVQRRVVVAPRLAVVFAFDALDDGTLSSRMLSLSCTSSG